MEMEMQQQFQPTQSQMQQATAQQLIQQQREQQLEQQMQQQRSLASSPVRDSNITAANASILTGGMADPAAVSVSSHVPTWSSGALAAAAPKATTATTNDPQIHSMVSKFCSSLKLLKAQVTSHVGVCIDDLVGDFLPADCQQGTECEWMANAKAAILIAAIREFPFLAEVDWQAERMDRRQRELQKQQQQGQQRQRNIDTIAEGRSTVVTDPSEGNVLRAENTGEKERPAEERDAVVALSDDMYDILRRKMDTITAGKSDVARVDLISTPHTVHKRSEEKRPAEERVALSDNIYAVLRRKMDTITGGRSDVAPTDLNSTSSTVHSPSEEKRTAGERVAVVATSDDVNRTGDNNLAVPQDGETVAKIEAFMHGRCSGKRTQELVEVKDTELSGPAPGGTVWL